MVLQQKSFGNKKLNGDTKEFVLSLKYATTKKKKDNDMI